MDLLVLANDHVFFTLFNRIHDLSQYIFRPGIVINHQWFFKLTERMVPLFLKLQPCFIKRPPESIDHNRYHDRSCLFYYQHRSFSAGCKWFGRSLWKGDHPILLQGPCDLPGIRRIKPLPHFLASAFQVLFTVNAPAKVKSRLIQLPFIVCSAAT